jgi:hypothetical protein
VRKFCGLIRSELYGLQPGGPYHTIAAIKKLVAENGYVSRLPARWLSKYGKESLSKDHARWFRALRVTLRPGDLDVETWAIDKLFEFARPGRYPVTVR